MDGMIGDNGGSQNIEHRKGAIIGFRSWILKNGKLVSPLTQGQVWHPGVNQATCQAQMGHPKRKTWHLNSSSLLSGMFGITTLQSSGKVQEPVPHKQCQCGLYAYYDPRTKVIGRDLEVHGAVLMWGRIELHQLGMRAQFAMPILLATKPGSYPQGSFKRFAGTAENVTFDKKIREAAQRYSMETVDFPDLVKKASEYGSIYPL